MPGIIKSRVIPWEQPDLWGVVIRYANVGRSLYPVSSRDDAERALLDPRLPWSEHPYGDDQGMTALVD